jgi:hypothetical protein
MVTDPEDSPEGHGQQEQRSSPDLEQAVRVQPPSNGGSLTLTLTLTMTLTQP